jgi:polysaccharide export outer membrane protein
MEASISQNYNLNYIGITILNVFVSKQMNNRTSLYIKFLIGSFLLLAGSCIGYKKTLYFQGAAETLPPPKLTQTYTLRVHDIVQIKIANPDAENPAVLSGEQGNIQSNVADAYFRDYYINDSGYVELPVIGKLKLVGYTVFQADSLIAKKAVEYYSNVTVEVKLASFKFMALGEFTKAGLCFVSNETCTIYEAIAIAGDVTDFANNEKVQLIRTLEDGSKKIYHVNLTDYSSFTSDNYYLQPNDILYVQAQKAKVDKQNITYLSIGLSAVSFILVLLTRI